MLNNSPAKIRPFSGTDKLLSDFSKKNKKKSLIADGYLAMNDFDD